MKRSGFTRVEFMATIAVTVIAGTLLLPILPGFADGSADAERDQETARRSACQSNLRQVALAIKQYLQDYDETFPTVASGRTAAEYGWVATVQPYIRTLQVFQCPSDRHAADTDPRQPGYTDYWYNRNLSRVNESQITFTANTMLNGDGDGGYKNSNARYALNALPPVWINTPGSPARRHLDGANYAFTDGHVKWCKPGSITNNEPNDRDFTFQVE